MKRYRALFRVDAGPEIGNGHLYRCLTLAEQLNSVGFHSTFFCRALPDALAVAVESRGHTLVCLDLEAQSQKAEAESFIGLLQGAVADLVVVDHYGLDAAWEHIVSRQCRLLFVIDDLANRPHECRILLDQTLGRRSSDYVSFTPSDCQRLCGSEFALLAKDYHLKRSASMTKRKNLELVRRVVVSFGGSSQPQLVEDTFASLKTNVLAASCQFVVVLSERDYMNTELRDYLSNHELDIEVVSKVNDMATLWLESDMAIGAAGTSTWERACLGLPSILCVIADNQELIAEAVDATGACKAIRYDNDYSHNLETAFAMFFQSELYQEMVESNYQVCDGEGAIRAVEVILSEL